MRSAPESRPLLASQRRCVGRKLGIVFGVIAAVTTVLVAVVSSVRVQSLQREQSLLLTNTQDLLLQNQQLQEKQASQEEQIRALQIQLEVSEAEIVALRAQSVTDGKMSGMSMASPNIFAAIPSFVTAWTSGQRCANFLGEYAQMMACEESDTRCPGSVCSMSYHEVLPPRPDVVAATKVTLPELSWTNCEIQGGSGKCASLEFCAVPTDGIYGYRLPGTTTCTAPGPTIRLTRGQKFWLKLHNTADVSVKTNLHTHGLHIIGDGNSDDVTRFVQGGYVLNYLWDLPQDHLGGTHWYHAHVHETTKVQVVGGAYGLLIVEDADEDFANAVEKERVKTFAQSELTIQFYKNQTANGVSLLSHEVISGQWYRVRISMVDESATGGNLTVRGECEHHLMAADGIWRSIVPAEPRTGYYVSGASRIDLAIRCASSGGGLDVRGTPMVDFVIVDGSPNDGTPFSDGISSTWTRIPVTYLEDQRDGEVDEVNTLDIAITGSTFNGASYNSSEPLAGATWTLGEYHEWTLNSQTVHPLHLHLYPMQVQNDLCGDQVGNHEVGEFYDVIYKASPGCKVRFHLTDHAGRCVVHCHLLSHEDAGAMSWLQINDANGEPFTPPTDPPKEPYPFEG